MARLYTPFNGPGGQSYLSDEDRLNVVRGEGDAARAAAAAELAARIQMHNADLAERGASRMQQGSMFERGLSSQEKEAQAGRDFQGGMFDKESGLQRDLDTSATNRAFGLADRQNAVALQRLAQEKDQYNNEHWQDQIRRAEFERIKAARDAARNNTAGGASPNEFDNEVFNSVLTGRPAPDRQAQMQTLIAPLLQQAIAKGDTELMGKLFSMMPGAQGLSEVAGEAFKPTMAEQEKRNTENLNTLSQGFSFQDSLAGINKLAADARNGRASTQDVVNEAEKLVQLAVAQKIPEQQARRAIGAELDQTLPGLGRDILSGISATAASVFTPTWKIPGRFANVGAASELRNRLGQQGFLR